MRKEQEVELAEMLRGYPEIVVYPFGSKGDDDSFLVKTAENGAVLNSPPRPGDEGQGILHPKDMVQIYLNGPIPAWPQGMHFLAAFQVGRGGKIEFMEKEPFFTTTMIGNTEDGSLFPQSPNNLRLLFRTDDGEVVLVSGFLIRQDVFYLVWKMQAVRAYRLGRKTVMPGFGMKWWKAVEQSVGRNLNFGFTPDEIANLRLYEGGKASQRSARNLRKGQAIVRFWADSDSGGTGMGELNDGTKVQLWWGDLITDQRPKRIEPGTIVEFDSLILPRDKRTSFRFQAIGIIPLD
jgi:hypothetical protein